MDCVARSRFVGLYEGVLLGKVCSPGVVAVDGLFRSRSCDVHRQVLWREEVIPRPPCRFLPCVWPLRDSRRARVAVRRHRRSGGRLRWAGHACAASRGAGRSRVFMRVCSRIQPAAAQDPGGFLRRCTRALQRALKISCTRTACAAWASVSVWMVGCSCSPSTSAQIWWIAKTGHRLGAVKKVPTRTGPRCAPSACNPC